jgi:uncharacterized protein YcfJ
MKKTVLAIAAALAAVPPAAFAGDGGAFEDYARVREVDPQYEKVNVRRKECYTDYVPESHYEPRSSRGLVGPLIGGVAGGLLGAQVGRGNGKVAAAATGAAIGAIVGDRLSDRGREREVYSEREVRRCRVVDDWESRPAGYRVVYEYAGHVYTTVLPYDPGHKLAVTVAVSPAEGDREGYERHPRDRDWDQ